MSGVTVPPSRRQDSGPKSKPRLTDQIQRKAHHQKVTSFQWIKPVPVDTQCCVSLCSVFSEKISFNSVCHKIRGKYDHYCYHCMLYHQIIHAYKALKILKSSRVELSVRPCHMLGFMFYFFWGQLFTISTLKISTLA